MKATRVHEALRNHNVCLRTRLSRDLGKVVGGWEDEGWLVVGGVFWLIEEVLFGGFANLFIFISTATFIFSASAGKTLLHDAKSNLCTGLGYVPWRESTGSTYQGGSYP